MWHRLKLPGYIKSPRLANADGSEASAASDGPNCGTDAKSIHTCMQGRRKKHPAGLRVNESGQCSALSGIEPEGLFFWTLDDVRLIHRHGSSATYPVVSAARRASEEGSGLRGKLTSVRGCEGAMYQDARVLKKLEKKFILVRMFFKTIV